MSSSFKPEVEAVVQADFAPLVTVEEFPCNCPCGSPLEAIERSMPKAGGRTVEVWGGVCLRAWTRTAGPSLGVWIRTFEPCEAIFVGRTLVEELQREGAWVVTPGWLRRWKDEQGLPGRSRGHDASRVVLLDTGTDPEASALLSEFAQDVGLPTQTLRVGLDYLRLQISLAVQEWRENLARDDSSKALARAQLQWSHFRMVLDLLGSIARLTSEDECIEKVLDVFELLYEPEHLSLVPVRSGVFGSLRVRCGSPRMPPESALRLPTHDYEWLPEDESDRFHIPATHGGDVLAVVTVGGLRFPEYLAEYSISAATVAGVCGLAIANARAYQRLVQASHAQKLESLGRMAAALAHEMNTPLQYASHNLAFLRDAFKDLQDVLEACQEQVASGGSPEGRLATALQGANVDFLSEEIPGAIDQGCEGIERVSRIVRAMRDFAEPGLREKAPADLNDLLQNVITLSRNEWQPVAELVPDLDPSLAEIPCLAAELSQVFLNLITNAAHAIADHKESGACDGGVITVSTRRLPPYAEIRFADTGTGIPEAHRHKIFDPFFTTKEIGKGLGQSLALARAIVVESHGGTMTFETKDGQGTVFILRIPLA